MPRPRDLRLDRQAARVGVLALALGAANAPADPLDGASYTLGRGLDLPAMHLRLSGYTSLRGRNLAQDPARLDLRDLSMFARWQPGRRWHLFSEIEVENAFVVDDRGFTTGDIEIAVERLYVEAAVNDTDSVRAGRFLTPFGRWNQVHADPLVWTVSRPLVTALTIPDHGTGGAWLGTHDLASGLLEYTAYADDSHDLDPVNGEADFEDVEAPGLVNDFAHGGGGQLRYHFLGGRAELAASYASFRFAGIAGLHHALGVDGILRWGRAEFSFESAWRHNGGPFDGDDFGAFAQAVVPLVGHVYGVARVEHYRSAILDRDAGRRLLGLAWRPVPPVTFKLEYHAGDDARLTPDGCEASVSILF
ncbi:MAG: hypothetical protein AB7O21_17705 [Gammaproteobacteria bacterium]